MRELVRAVPSDGGSEMCVDIHGEAIVVEIVLWHHATSEVFSLHHASGGEYTQHGVEVRVVGYNSFIQRFSQALVTGYIHGYILYIHGSEREREAG